MSNVQPKPGLRILIVDDDKDTTALFSLLLARLGYSSQGLTDPTLTASAATEFRPHLIFIDLAMPGMSGFDVIRQLRDDPRTQQIPIVVTSGYANEEFRTRAMQEGANHFLPKPADLEQIRTVVSRYVR